MIIRDKKTIAEIQQEFNNKFPHLKIEFYEKTHQTNEGSPDSVKWDADKRIGDIRTKHNTGELSIDGHLKVSSLENNFLEKYGLNVQVFYRSGDIWLQTINTDDWTLTKHNERGKISLHPPQRMEDLD